jgi:hypothetical protein
VKSSALRLRAPLLCCSYLSGQRIKVYEQKPTQLMHLIRHFLRRLFVTMHRVVAVKPELVSPCLQLWRNPVLRGHAINSLFKLPCLDVWGKGLKAKFHRFSIHAASGIVMASNPGASSLIVGAGDWRRYALWRVTYGRSRIEGTNFVLAKSVEYISYVIVRSNSTQHPYYRHDWAKADIAYSGETKDRIVFRTRKGRRHREAGTLSAAVRAIVGKAGHSFRDGEKVESIA